MPGYDAFASMMSGPNQPALELLKLRQEREREARNRLLGMFRGDPEAGRQANVLGDIEDDLNSDPYTGLAPQQRQAGIQAVHDRAALNRQPEMIDDRQMFADEAERNKQALARAGVTGEAEGAISPAGTALAKRSQFDKIEQLLAPGKQQAEQTKEYLDQINGGGARGDGSAQWRASINPKGGVTMAQQINRMPAGIMDRVAGLAESLQIATDMEDLFPKIEGKIGPISGPFQNFLQGMPGWDANPDWAKFRAQTATLKNSIIKAYTGAQMSEPEAIRLGAQIPKESDKPEVWRQKMEVNKRNLSGLNILIDQLNKGVAPSDLNTGLTGPTDSGKPNGSSGFERIR